MRVTKEQAAENRQKILDAAARLFRARGFDAVAVADLMSAAGFTHGGFYNHFESKEALAAEAARSHFTASRPALAEALGSTKPKAWNAYARAYVSPEHRDHPETGCLVSALASDAARQGEGVQRAFAEHVAWMTEALAEHLGAIDDDAPGAKERREQALRTWSELVGALVLARAVAGADPALSDEILEDPATLRSGAEKADAVVHCAFDHDFSRFAENCQKDARNIEAMGEALAGSQRPLLISSGVGMGSRGPGQLGTEDSFDDAHQHPRKISEQTGNALLARGLNVSFLRLPQVHDTRKQGLITPLVEIARAKGRVAYLGEGKNRFAAGHVSDVAELYKLAIERATPGARWNAVAEEGVAMKDIAEALGRAMKLPVASVSGEEASAYFGWMMMFAGGDMIALSTITRAKLGWTPVGPGLIADLERLEG